MANIVDMKNASRRLSIASGPKSFLYKSLKHVSSHKWGIGKGTGPRVASFLVKIIALETVRRFSSAKCPFLWRGLQGLQVLCWPPFIWIERWKPFGILVNGMQMISRPLLVLSIANALSDHSERSCFCEDDADNSPSADDPLLGSDDISGPPALQNTRIGVESPQGLLSTEWINRLCQELEKQGISLPERIDQEELQRFYVASDGDFSHLLSSIKKTVRWRETYRILSGEELEIWSNLVFWHEDVNHRPCLIVRLGLACAHLPSHDKPRFAQAVVSQVEHGVLHFVDGENPQITVLVDCQGMTPLKIPVRILRHCCNILQDHFPNILAGLIVIRLPSGVRVIAQPIIQDLKPATKQKLRIEGESFQMEYFRSLPSYLGGQCTCISCAKLHAGCFHQISDRQTSVTEPVSASVNGEHSALVQPSNGYDDMIMENHWSRTLRSAVIGILIIWVLTALIEGVCNP